MPRESLDPPEDLPKEAPCQMTLGKLQDMVADGLEVAVIGGLLLRPVHWTLGAVDIEGPPPSR